jgi:hypothetical protein
MDFSNPWLIVSGLLIGVVGFFLFNYGRKEPDLKALAAGMVLCVYPYFVGSVIILWLVFAGVMGALYAWNKYV